MEKDYDYGVDTWAIGCVVGEILKMINISDSKPKEKHTALFPGYCCYPLSPADKDQGEINGFPFNRDDQLYYILDLIGSPDPNSDLSFISDKEALEYIKSLPKRKKKQLEAMYPHVDFEALDLLRQLLTFDPSKRISVEKCLKHDFFSDVIDDTHSAPLSKPINIHFENDLEKNLAEEKLREYFLEEFMIATVRSNEEASASGY